MEVESHQNRAKIGAGRERRYAGVVAECHQAGMRVVRVWDLTRMGSFGGLGAELPTAGGSAGFRAFRGRRAQATGHRPQSEK